MAKTLRVEIEVAEDDGRTIVKRLEGDDAAQWGDMVNQVCVFAEIHRANPAWGSLNWQRLELNQSQELNKEPRD